jgi:hypothetical protein
LSGGVHTGLILAVAVVVAAAVWSVQQRYEVRKLVEAEEVFDRLAHFRRADGSGGGADLPREC